jgi:hypothetical protein
MVENVRVKEGETDDQQLGFEHFIADVEDSNVEFKQSQKVRPSILSVGNQLIGIGPYTLETGYEGDVGCSIVGTAGTVICQFKESVRVGEVGW